MKRKTALITVLIFAIAVGLYSRKESTEVAIPERLPSEERVIASTETPMEPQEMTDSEVNKKMIPEKTEVNKTATITPGEINTLHETLPDKGKVNEEVKQNPHTPSKSLMTFAKRLGPLMEKAFKDENDANILVKELSTCANDESVAKSARAMCVTNTERLGEVHPKIEKSAINLRAGVSPEVQKILDTNDSFIIKK